MTSTLINAAQCASGSDPGQKTRTGSRSDSVLTDYRIEGEEARFKQILTTISHNAKRKTLCVFSPENQKLENLFIRTQNYIYSDPVQDFEDFRDIFMLLCKGQNSLCLIKMFRLLRRSSVILIIDQYIDQCCASRSDPGQKTRTGSRSDSAITDSRRRRSMV